MGLFKKVSEVKQVEFIKTTKLVYSILTFDPIIKMIPRVVFFDNEIKRVNFSIKKRIKNMNNLIENQSKKLETEFKSYAINIDSKKRNLEHKLKKYP